uniref:Beta-defensin n=1 Tax=Sus scrofa TaxID=9823 RepID=A0A8D1WCY2_PIG
MKLLFPIFASLMLQYQVNTEYFGLGRCVMGLGRCKDHCAVNEKEIDKCKKKKCCIGPKGIQLIKSYLQNEMIRTLEEVAKKNITKNSKVVTPSKYRPLSHLPEIKSTNPFASINTIIIPNGTTVNSTTTNSTTSRRSTHPATSTKSDTKKRRDSPTESPPADSSPIDPADSMT